MIKTNEEIIELLKKTFKNAIVYQENWGDVVISFKGSKDYCTFNFNFFDEKNNFCAEQFKNHNCLAFGFEENNGGVGYMVVADESDQTNSIIDFVEKHLKNAKRKEYEQLNLFETDFDKVQEEYEQMSLFEEK